MSTTSGRAILTQRLVTHGAAITNSGRVRWQRSRHERFLREVLADLSMSQQVAEGKPLPAGYGRAYTERVIEYPWVLGNAPHGDLLDAGGTLNHSVVLDALPATVRSIRVVTLAPEPRNGDPRISYTWADLREIPLRDASFDTIACLSTLEHVGMDNAGYGADDRCATDPRAECLKAVREFRRVIRPGGTLLISVPFGAPTHMRTMRQITTEELSAWRNAFQPSAEHLAVFAYGRSGWAPSSPAAARNALYRERSTELVARDRAQAARAVACLAMTA